MPINSQLKLETLYIKLILTLTFASTLFLIIQNLIIMSKQEDFDAALAEIADATTAISARIQAFIDAAANGDTISTESIAALQADADALKALGTPAV